MQKMRRALGGLIQDALKSEGEFDSAFVSDLKSKNDLERLREAIFAKFDLFDQMLSSENLSKKLRTSVNEKFVNFVNEILKAGELNSELRSESLISTRLKLFEKIFKSENIKKNPELKRTLDAKFIEFIKGTKFDLMVKPGVLTNDMINLFVQDPNVVAEMFSAAENYLKESPTMSSVDNIVSFMGRINNIAVNAKLAPLKLSLENFRNNLLQSIPETSKRPEIPVQMRAQILNQLNQISSISGVKFEINKDNIIEITSNTVDKSKAEVFSDLINNSLLLESKDANNPVSRRKYANLRQMLFNNMDPTILQEIRLSGEIKVLSDVFKKTINNVSSREAFSVKRGFFAWIIRAIKSLFKIGQTSKKVPATKTTDNLHKMLGMVSQTRTPYDNIPIYLIEKYLLTTDKWAQLSDVDAVKLIKEAKEELTPKERELFNIPEDSSYLKPEYFENC